MESADNARASTDIDVGALKHGLYALLALVLADAEISRLTKSRDGEDLAGADSGKHLIVSALLRVAVTMRYLIDNQSNRDAVAARQKCGVWWKTEVVHGETTYPLILREACNKIIHSEKILLTPKEEKLSDGVPGYLQFSTEIEIWGEKDGDKWGAKLNIIKFVQASRRALAMIL